MTLIASHHKELVMVFFISMVVHHAIGSMYTYFTNKDKD